MRRAFVLAALVAIMPLAAQQRWTERAYLREHPVTSNYRIVQAPVFVTIVTENIGEIPMIASPGPFLEHAGHEGNYGLFRIPAGARADERQAVK